MSVAVVTGGGSGIGRATCARLLAEGFTLAVLDMNGDAASAAAGPGGTARALDVADAPAVAQAFTEIVAELGRIDVLVNNAGISGSPAATVCHETPVEDWDRVLATNTRGPFLCSRAALPVMLAQGSGHVITVASVAGEVAFPGRCAYTASKGAALMFAKSLALDYAHAGIRSNAVCPGFVRTPMTQWRLDIPELAAQVEANIPIGRIAEPDDVADAISVLASGRMGYMTGHALVVDGGWTAR
ncbi:SDR family oxidoreductase [Actinomycetospora sp.]|jgi:NAD(P)-dependent dehydrogenase (short-subunit alcohol dehydrogenase family)|uniref:SDR family NAD(P)-dependent oxidoreductase n=1 Tax=Actinomycetospora sp. TaxID=1872135 RepID=UPI002F427A17